MRISDWSSDVCSSDLQACRAAAPAPVHPPGDITIGPAAAPACLPGGRHSPDARWPRPIRRCGGAADRHPACEPGSSPPGFPTARSEEHTSELQSLMRISYAVFCLKKKKNYKHTTITHS